jgi:hypothetical protein
MSLQLSKQEILNNKLREAQKKLNAKMGIVEPEPINVLKLIEEAIDVPLMDVANISKMIYSFVEYDYHENVVMLQITNKCQFTDFSGDVCYRRVVDECLCIVNEEFHYVYPTAGELKVCEGGIILNGQGYMIKSKGSKAVDGFLESLNLRRHNWIEDFYKFRIIFEDRPRVESVSIRYDYPHRNGNFSSRLYPWNSVEKKVYELLNEFVDKHIVNEARRINKLKV